MLNYGLRLNQILNNPGLCARCLDLGVFLDESSVEELKGYYQNVVDSIFGFPAHTGWGLRRVTRTSQPKETDAIVKLLGPDGPLFKAMYRLMTDRNYLLDYPVSSLPPVLERKIGQLDIPDFFGKKLQLVYDTYGQVAPTRNLTLNPFEYYFFVFTYANLGSGVSQNYLMGWGTLNDSAYANLLDEYNNYFFPCDGTAVPPISAQGKQQLETTFNTDSSIQSGTRTRVTISPPPRLDSPHPTLFRASVFQENVTVPVTTLESSFSSIPYSYLELWRSETLLGIIMEMWMGVDSDDTVSSIFLSNLPNVDLVKCVRMVVRHQHFFNNCVNQQALHPMEGLKRSIIPQYQRKLYLFLRYLFTRWPLDSTFRIVYETWLSYIQPWRYMKFERFRQFRDREVAIIEPHWNSFLVENIMFYTVLFQLLLPRCLRSDLTSYKNALMICRISKILTAQDNLRSLLANIEKVLVKYLSSPDEYPSHCSYGSASDSASLMEHLTSSRLNGVKQMLKELESPSFVYTPLFSESVRQQVNLLVTNITHAIQIRRDAGAGTAGLSLKGSNSFMQMLSNAGIDSAWQTDRSDTPAGAEEATRTLQLLELSKQHLMTLFGLHDDGDSELHSGWGDSNGSPSTPRENNLERTPGKFSPSIAESLVSRSTTASIPSENPDLANPKQHEIDCLIGFSRSLSSHLNRQYGSQIAAAYFQDDLKGRLTRAVFAAPIEYEVIEKPTPGRQIKVKHYLPPRVNLRPLASAVPVLVLLVSVVFFVFLCRVSSVGMISTASVLYVCKVVFHALMEPSNTVQELRRKFGIYAIVDDDDDLRELD